MRSEFTLSKRTAKGTAVYYYYTYDRDGNRRKYSTGQTTKAAALTYCLKLAKAGELIPTARNNETFENFFNDFWDWEKSPYLKKERLRGQTIGRHTVECRRGIYHKLMLPYFQGLKLRDITKNKVENWLLSLADRGLKTGSINQARIYLNIMLDYAINQGYLDKNPGKMVKPFIDKPTVRGILDMQEVNDLFNPSNINIYWNGNRYAYAANMLAALTGMRVNEIRALQAGDIRQNAAGYFLNVEHSLSRYGLKDTKNHKTREIPIPSKLRDLLIDVSPPGGGFVFSLDGKEPLPYYDFVNGGLYAALARMGISEQERLRRNICFHSWRHFYNTMLRAGNISEAKIRAITGHSEERMTDRYTHFTSKELQDIAGVQNAIIGGCHA